MKDYKTLRRLDFEKSQEDKGKTDSQVSALSFCSYLPFFFVCLFPVSLLK